MSETPPELDLKFLPDWLKEEPSPSRYANYEGESEDRGYRGGDRRGPGGPRRDNRRPGAPGGDRPRGPGGGPRGPGAGPRGPGGGGPRGPGGGGPRGPGGPRGDRPRGPGGPGARPGGPGGGRFENREPREPRPAPVAPPNLKIEFIPEPAAAEGIARQIKQSGRAYPLFGTGRLFLEKPERHRVRIGSLDPTVVLYQIGDGPIALDQASLERNAFQEQRTEFYEEVVVQGEPIKGNFSNVARSRATGTLLGPTSYHSYQPGLRRLYEERFSRRMSFQDFLHQDIDIRTDEQTINDWKEQARSVTTYKTRKEETPVEFKTLAEVEQHFRTTYLRQLVKAGLSLECSGPASRSLPERAVSFLLRDAWEREKAFPAQLVNYLRPYLVEAGLHFFKHRKRVLYVAASKPVRHKAGEAMSPGVSAILEAIAATPKCNRRVLATKLLGENPDAPELAERKASLARDLVYLLHAGHVIEFHDGTIDLPLQPQPPQPQGGGKGGAKPGAGQPGAPAAAPVEAGGEEGGEPDEAAETVGDEGTAESSPEAATITASAAEGGETLPSEGNLSESSETAAEEPLGTLSAPEGGEALAPVIVTAESEVPAAPAFVEAASSAAPVNPEEGGGFAASFQEAPVAPPAEQAAAFAYTGTETILPGTSSLAEAAPAGLLQPAEIVDLSASAAPEASIAESSASTDESSGTSH